MRSPFQLGALALTFLCLLAVPASAAPNVLILLGDDQYFGDYGFMGSPVVRTPHLDKLAGQSAVFPNGYVPTSLCRASLASLITGLYPHQHKIVGNDPPKGTDRTKMLDFIRSAPSLPRLLKDKGYDSLQTGKWWEGAPADGGFTEGMTHGDPKRGGRHGDLGLKVGRDGLGPIPEFLRNHKDKPFFLWYAPMMPHEPHNPPARLLEKYASADRPQKVAKYYAMCEWFDETVGEVLAELDKNGLSDNTLVFFLADNGWIAPAPNTSARFDPKSKNSPYDGGLRTPLMVRWPGHVKPAKLETLVSSIDIAPTILAACGLERSPGMQGIDLVQVAAGKIPERSGLFGELYTHDVADLANPAASLVSRWHRSGPWKLILPVKGAAELYDVSKDPTETVDLAAKEPAIVEKMRAEIEKWQPLAKP